MAKTLRHTFGVTEQLHLFGFLMPFYIRGKNYTDHLSRGLGCIRDIDIIMTKRAVTHPITQTIFLRPHDGVVEAKAG